MRIGVYIVSAMLFVCLAPFAIAWGMIKGVWQEIEDLARSLFLW